MVYPDLGSQGWSARLAIVPVGDKLWKGFP